MGGYIQWDKDLSDDPRVVELAAAAHARFPVDALGPAGSKGLWRDAILGGLVRMWTYADVHVDSADILPLSLSGLADVCGLPEDILRTFPRTWLAVDEATGRVKLPGYVAKNRIMARDERKENKDLKRSQWREQKRRQREKLSAERPAGHQGGQAETCPPNVHLSGGCPPYTGTGPVPIPDLKNPLPPPSGGPAVNGHGPKRPNGTNLRTLGTNPRTLAEKAAEQARWQPLLERARRANFREPHPIDTPETYETSLRLHERERDQSTPTARGNA